MKTEEGNKLISGFMGAEFNKDYPAILYPKEHLEIRYISDLLYHSSWDWLMPVWYKFRDMKVPVESEEQYYQSYSQQLHRVSAAITHLSIKDAHEKLVEAIQWYNNYNKTKSQ